MCWFHKWSKWSKPQRIKTLHVDGNYFMMKQAAVCLKCGRVRDHIESTMAPDLAAAAYDLLNEGNGDARAALSVLSDPDDETVERVARILCSFDDSHASDALVDEEWPGFKSAALAVLDALVPS